MIISPQTKPTIDVDISQQDEVTVQSGTCINFGLSFVESLCPPQGYRSQTQDGVTTITNNTTGESFDIEFAEPGTSEP